MRPGTAGIFFIICLNVATMILSGMNISPLPGWSDSMNLTATENDLENSVGSMMGQGGIEAFQFIGGLLLKLVWQLVSGIVLGFPQLCMSYGLPAAIYLPIYTVWLLMFLMWLWYVFTGREF